MTPNGADFYFLSCFLVWSDLIVPAGSVKALEPLVDFLSAMARALEAQQNRSTPKHVQLAKQLAQLLTAVGSKVRSQELLAAFPG